MSVAGCFFIFDNMIESETADPEECPLFFHPSSMPINLQSFLLGYVSAMAVFVEGFNGASLGVIQLRNSKMAVKRLDNGVLMVLAGRSDESDVSVQQHLEDIYKAFCFFYGSLQTVLDAHAKATRRDLLKAMRRIGEELMPLISNYHRNAYSSFNPLPYTVLLPHSTRVVVRAMQLLVALSSQKGNLGGAIYCSLSGQTSVLATQLPADATRWVCCRVSHVADSMATVLRRQGSAGVIVSNNSFNGSFVMMDDAQDALQNSQCDNLNVMLSSSLLQQLKDEAMHGAYFVQPEDWFDTGTIEASVGSLSTRPKLTGRELEADLGLPEAPQGHVYAGLLIIYVGVLSVAVLMDLDCLYDVPHIQRVRSLCDKPLLKLERDSRTFIPVSTSTSASQSSDTEEAVSAAASVTSPRPGLYSSASAPALLDSPMAPSVGSPFRNSSGTTPQRSRRPLGSSGGSINTSTSSLSSSNPSQISHWMFQHDDNTGSCTTATEGSLTVSQSELMQQANLVHDMFVRDGALQQVILKSANKSMVCKRMQSKEVYYLQQPPSQSCFDAESDAKKVLTEEYGIRML